MNKQKEYLIEKFHEACCYLGQAEETIVKQRLWNKDLFSPNSKNLE